MIPVFIIVGIALLGAAGRIGSLTVRIHPAHLVRLMLGVMVLGLVLVEVGLLLWFAPVALDLLGLTDLSQVCLKAVGGTVPGGEAGGLVSGLAAISLGATALRGGWNVLSTQADLRIESSLVRAEPFENFDLVVVPSPRRMAYTIGGRRPQVILTSTTVEELAPELVDVIMAHESVHARYRHDRFLALAAAMETAVGWLPPVATAVASVRLSLERWADEDAARQAPGGREQVRKALLVACLGHEVGHLAGFGKPEMVSARVASLDQPAQPRNAPLLRIAYALAGTTSLLAVVSVTWATRLSIIAVLNPGHCLV